MKTFEKPFVLLFSKNVPNSFGSILGPELTHPKASTSPSRSQYFTIRFQYFTIRCQYFTIRSQYFTIRGQYSTLNIFWFYLNSGNFLVCGNIISDRQNCATLYQWALLSTLWKYEILVDPLFKYSLSLEEKIISVLEKMFYSALQPISTYSSFICQLNNSNHR